MFEAPIISFESDEGFSIVNADILVDAADFEGVQLAVQNLAGDFGKVTGTKATIRNNASARASTVCIVVGSLTQSTIIASLRDAGKIDTSVIDGKWESWITTTIESPFEGYDHALVIVGSDKRGTIYGIYSLSEQIGISPWYWWADVPPKKHTSIVALPISTINGEPSIKYRGIFINDESPGMDSWAQGKFGPKFNTELYGHIFELLLRLKANYMWPAMWRGYPYPGRSFFVDDPGNQKLADSYGIVVGTSHHEPMQRAMNEWSTTQPAGTWNWETNREKVTEYFQEGAERAEPFESYVTIGMRGEGDGPISGSDPLGTLTEVIAVQRDIFKDVYGSEDGVMQTLALYKEVQEIYDQGLEVPEDVTLMFSDDNFGTLRRLPTEDEKQRKGGIGLYYHYQYTGTPRSYRWTNSNSLSKALQQLQLAYHEQARQIWIFNVGDLKPQEVPMSFSFDLAWNVDSIKPAKFLDYYKALATREFGTENSEAIADAWYEYDRLVALRKHEMIEPDTFSLLKYHEADTVVSRWANALKIAESAYTKVPDEQKSAFFELVLWPIKSSYNYVLLRVTQYRNQLFAKQRRNTTNVLFHKCISLFDTDHDLTQEYHTIENGKWNNLLRQAHFGFTSSWMGPSRNMISGLCYVQNKEDSNPSVGQMGIAVEGIEGVDPGLINEDSDRTHPSRLWLERGVTLPYISPYGVQTRYFEVFHCGTKEFSWVATPQYDWIKLSQYEGTMAPGDDDPKINITIDWSSVPENFDEDTTIEIVGSVDGYELVHLTVKNRQLPSDFTGFAETDGYLSVEAGNWVVDPYVHLPALGRPVAGAVSLPNDIDLSAPEELPFLHYPIYAFTQHDNTNLELQFTTTIDTNPNQFLEYDLRWDGGDVQTFRLTSKGTGDLPMGWTNAVQDAVWKRSHNVGNVGQGSHSIEIRLRSTNICFEKLILDLGQIQKTYLGPAESQYVEAENDQMRDVLSEDELEIRLAM